MCCPIVAGVFKFWPRKKVSDVEGLVFVWIEYYGHKKSQMLRGWCAEANYDQGGVGESGSGRSRNMFHSDEVSK